MVLDDTRRPGAVPAADRRLLPRRVLRAVRAVPGRHRPPGGGAAPPDARSRGRRRRAGAAARRRPGDAGRVDLRARADRWSAIESAIDRSACSEPSDGIDERQPRRPRRAGSSSSPSTARRSACPRARRSSTPAEPGSTCRRCATATRSRPKNACRVCVVEVEGARALVPSCSRKVEPGMVVHTDTERARHARRLVLELLGSSVDLSTDARGGGVERRVRRRPVPLRVADGRAPVGAAAPRSTTTCTCATTRSASSATSASTPAASSGRARSPSRVAGRGFDARISHRARRAAARLGLRLLRQLHRGVPDRRAVVQEPSSTCAAGARWDESRQTQTDTICPYCGVGCTLTLHVQDNRDRQGHLAARPARHPRQPLHQGPLRLPARPEPRRWERWVGAPDGAG